MQEARGSSPLSSTFPQLRGHFWSLYLIFDRLQCCKKSPYLASLHDLMFLQVSALLRRRSGMVAAVWSCREPSGEPAG